MSEENNKKSNDNTVCVGLDVGTMNIIASRSDLDEPKIIRNMFLKLDKDEIDLNEMTDISYIESEEGEIFIVGDDAFRFCNIFGKEVSRPMKDGVISPNEIDAVDVLALMINDLIGETDNKDVYCSYSIPAESIDKEKSITYHEKVFGRILHSLGVNYTPVNEADAIIYNECKNEGYSGCAISYGAGMANISLMYKGVPVLQFSTARSGDYIDHSVANSLDVVQNRVTSVKEKKFALNKDFMQEKNKKTRRILESIYYYYGALIEYTVKKIINKFEQDVDIDVDEELPIIISGGTSMTPGFIDMFNEILNKYDLPFDVSEVRHAESPLTCVSNGLLQKTMKDVGMK